MRELTCIICPNGCLLSVEETGGRLKVSGNLCPRGAQFALSELTDPKRTVCSTVATDYPDAPVLPVRTQGEVPKGKIFAVMRAISAARVDHPVRPGEVVIRDVAGTGVDVIATGELGNK